ncbi:alpha beta hydrolase fold family [Ophiocordyceps sinensis CO18]|uniref:Alpha beta hydrolase fold family n=1 Tax=Ophiocordyceps sinensis (strain Co18 / CGMCC 3.14243) TaxID=911162 RepID=T5AJ70_OPHSC|nr:alpha beta hydrolase fold family [Ophiocordyceps sinensis CO18]
MAVKSLWDYVFIRTCIFLLHLVAPLSVVFSLVSSLFLLPFPIPRALKVWLALEAAFYLAVYLPHKEYLQRAAKHPVPPCRQDRRELFLRCHETIPDPDLYLRKWFRDAPADEIKRENVKDFFRWAFLNTGDADPAFDEELEDYASRMERLLGGRLGARTGQRKVPPTDAGQGRDAAPELDLCVFVVDTIASVSLRYHSFDFYRTSLLQILSIFPPRPFMLAIFATYSSPGKLLTYWHRPHTSKSRLPVLFVHGIGVGLYPYINFLAHLNANEDANPDGQVGIIALEIMPVSSRLTAEAMLKDEMCGEIRRIVEAHGWDKFVLVTHSYGSVVAAHLLRNPQMARKIGPILFVDPVSFLLHLPDVAYNFICRQPSRYKEHLFSYFGSKDIGIAHTLFRRFFWADNILWKEDIRGHRVTVALAGRDAIIDAKTVGAYLVGSKDWTLETARWKNGLWQGDEMDVLWFPNLDHGQAFDERGTRSRLVQIVRGFCSMT